MTDARGSAKDAPLGTEARAYYAGSREATRLFHGHGPLELARTQKIVGRRLPAPPARVLDVGGGPGVHAVWLEREPTLLGLSAHVMVVARREP